MDTCATTSRTLAEPLSATAATARAWLLVEQPGPWGARALTDSRLDPQLGRTLDRAAAAHGVRTALLRRPGRHPDPQGAAGHRRSAGLRRLFLAHTAPGGSWIRTALVPADGLPGLLGALDLAGIGAGDHGGLGEAYEGQPLALVCTNGKRDRCCALLGRPLAAQLKASGTGDVWEITHIGGHRFAPTVLVLPYGYAYGRATAATVEGVLDAVRSGRVPTGGCRGRSTWERPGQAADLAVREHTGESGADALTVVRTHAAPGAAAAPGRPAREARWTVTVAHRDGRVWHVSVTEAEEGPPAAASCGAAPGVQTRMRVDGIAQGAGQVTADVRG